MVSMFIIWLKNGPVDLVIFADMKNVRLQQTLVQAANSPFVGEELTGALNTTICDGEIVYQV